MKLGKVKRNLIGLGCGALLCAALSANVTQYQNKSSENFLYLRTRKATQEIPCSGKVKVYGAGGPDIELKYTGYDSNDKYYLRGMLEDKATGYGLMVGSWTP